MTKNIHLQMWKYICRYIFFEDGNKLKISFEIKPPLHESIIRYTDNGAKKYKVAFGLLYPKDFKRYSDHCRILVDLSGLFYNIMP